MAAQKKPVLTDAELEIMNVLWDQGPSRVRAIVDALPRRKAYTTVLTLLGILEKKGYVRHTVDGPAHVWHPAVSREEVRRAALRRLVDKLFEGSAELLVAHLLEDEELGGKRRRRKG